MDVLDALVWLSYIALVTDVCLQIRRIEKTKSSRDISLTGVFFRLAASLIILAKLVNIKDISLAAGQAAFVIVFAAYFYLVFTHLKHRRK